MTSLLTSVTNGKLFFALLFQYKPGESIVECCEKNASLHPWSHHMLSSMELISSALLKTSYFFPFNWKFCQIKCDKKYDIFTNHPSEMQWWDRIQKLQFSVSYSFWKYCSQCTCAVFLTLSRSIRLTHCVSMYQYIMSAMRLMSLKHWFYDICHLYAANA